VNVVLSDVNSWKKKLDITVPAADLDKKSSAKLTNYQKTAKIDGFRKGKAPKSLIEKRYGDSIKAEAIDDIIDENVKAAIIEHKLDIVTQAKVVRIDFNDDKDLEFTAEVEVYPEVVLGEYLNLKVEKDVYPVTDKEVDETIEKLQQEAAEVKETEKPAEEGSLVRGTVQEMDESGVPVIGKKWEGQVFELGRMPITGDSMNQLLGVKKGDERPFTMQVPKKDGSPETLQLAMAVETVFEKKLPELDAEFVKRFGEFESVETFRKHVKERLTAENEKQSNTMLENRLIDEIIKKNDFELPPSLIETGLDNLWEDYTEQQRASIDEAEFRERQKPAVEWNLKWYLLRDKIIEKENIEVTDADIEEYIGTIEEISAEEAAKFRRQIKSKASRERFERDLTVHKAMEFLKEHSKIKEIKKKNTK